jgi:hypothetical protein
MGRSKLIRTSKTARINSLRPGPKALFPDENSGGVFTTEHTESTEGGEKSKAGTSSQNKPRLFLSVLIFLGG